MLYSIDLIVCIRAFFVIPFIEAVRYFVSHVFSNIERESFSHVFSRDCVHIKMIKNQHTFSSLSIS